MSQPGDLGHTRDALTLVVALLLVTDDLGDAHALVLSKDLAGAVLRAVVGDDHEVNSLSQVVVDVRLDDFRLVADDEGHHQLHVRGRGASRRVNMGNAPPLMPDTVTIRKAKRVIPAPCAAFY